MAAFTSQIKMAVVYNKMAAIYNKMATVVFLKVAELGSWRCAGAVQALCTPGFPAGRRPGEKCKFFLKCPKIYNHVIILTGFKTFGAFIGL